MNVTTQRRSLGLLALCLLVGTVGAVVWSMSNVKADPQASTESSGPAVKENFSPQTQQPTDVSDRALSVSLRGPLYDPPKPKPAATRPARPTKPKSTKPAAPPAAPKLTLTGTLKGKNQHLAILSDVMNKFDVKGVGETLDLSPEGVTIKNIDVDRITVTYQGRDSTLTLNRKTKGGGSTARKPKRPNARRRGQ